ncbi:MAG: hypothetical protein ACREPF_12330 [Rhodanobacteraceae bacterium]
MSRQIGLFAAVAVALGTLSGCATTPMGPTIPVMPAPNEPFQAFVADQNACKQYAASAVSGQADAANDRAVGAAAISTAIGAAIGGAIGGGRGAGIGAAEGAGVGAAVGGSNSQYAQPAIQVQYNNAYAACMYSKGAQVPGAAPPPPPPGEPPRPLPPPDQDR